MRHRLTRRRNEAAEAAAAPAKKKQKYLTPAARARALREGSGVKVGTLALSALQSRIGKLSDGPAVRAVARLLAEEDITTRPEVHTGAVYDKDGRNTLRVYIWRNVPVTGAASPYDHLVLAGGPNYSSKLALGSTVTGGNDAGVYIQSLLSDLSGRSGAALTRSIERGAADAARRVATAAKAAERRAKRAADVAAANASRAERAKESARKRGDAAAARKAAKQQAEAEAQEAEAEAVRRAAAEAERLAKQSEAAAKRGDDDAAEAKLVQAEAKIAEVQAAAVAAPDAPKQKISLSQAKGLVIGAVAAAARVAEQEGHR